MDEQLAKEDAQVGNRAKKTSPLTILPPDCVLTSMAPAGVMLSPVLSGGEA